MNARQLWFTQPEQLEIRTQPLPQLAAGQLRVASRCSAISAGTEMLVYRGQLPTDIAVDATLAALQQQPGYPMLYGYACVGAVEQIGAGVDAAWLGRRVFAFQPHASHFITTPEQVMPIPEDISDAGAVFLANMETAVNFVLDGKPMLGERVIVLGQGIVGLLLIKILARYPLAQLYALDALAERRLAAQSVAPVVYDPGSESDMALLKQQLNLPIQLQATAGAGADLIYEVTGAPEALNTAIDLCSYSGRIVIGSWYGNKTSHLQLGGAAHRNRLQLISSQVSTIAPELSGRWDKARRFDSAWAMIRALEPEQLITHQVELSHASTLYQLLAAQPEKVLQAIITY